MNADQKRCKGQSTKRVHGDSGAGGSLYDPDWILKAEVLKDACICLLLDDS